MIAPTAVTTPVGLIERTESKLILPINNEAMFPVNQLGEEEPNQQRGSMEGGWRVAFDEVACDERRHGLRTRKTGGIQRPSVHRSLFDSEKPTPSMEQHYRYPIDQKALQIGNKVAKDDNFLSRLIVKLYEIKFASLFSTFG